MPPSVEDRLRDVLEAIQGIEAMLADMNLEQFSADNIRRMATGISKSHAKPRENFLMMSNRARRKSIGVR